MSDNFNKDTFQKNHGLLITAASDIGNDTIISGLCPRSDDICGNIFQVNQYLKQLAEQMKCKFIDNDPSFRKSNKTLNTRLFKSDNIHLSKKGIEVLADEYGIKEKESATKINHSAPAIGKPNISCENKASRTKDNKHRKGQQRQHTGKRTTTQTLHEGQRQQTDRQTQQKRALTNYEYQNRAYNRAQTNTRQDSQSQFSSDRPNNLHNLQNTTESSENYQNGWQSVSYRRRTRRDCDYKSRENDYDVCCWFCGETNHTTNFLEAWPRTSM